MRELKFRVWNPDQSKLEYFDLHNITVSDNLLCQDNHPVQQFTSAIDKNGKDIYEGDIVRAYNKKENEEVLRLNEEDFVGEVKFDDEMFYTFCVDIEETLCKRSVWSGEGIEVIGNTYEPPCNPDHNGECLVCDEWLTNCPFKL